MNTKHKGVCIHMTKRDGEPANQPDFTFASRLNGEWVDVGAVQRLGAE